MHSCTVRTQDDFCDNVHSQPLGEVTACTIRIWLSVAASDIGASADRTGAGARSPELGALTILQTFDNSSDKVRIEHLHVGDEGIETPDLVPTKRADRGQMLIENLVPALAGVVKV
jgi:hypothetical protein